MDDTRIPKQVLYGELSRGKRTRGRPKLRYKDVCKSTLKELYIDESGWEKIADDRNKWRSTVYDGANAYNTSRNEKAEQTRQRHKDNAGKDPNYATVTFDCSFCRKPCRSNIGRISHERHCSNKE